MNNRKIKVFLLIACIINLTITNCIPVYATMPGVVEAENVWLTLETLALTMGVNLPFIPDKSISYNNNKRKQEMIDYIDWEYSQGVLTQQQHDDAIQELDNLLLYGGEHGVGSAISMSQALWTRLSNFFYEKYIERNVSLVGSLSPSARALFDSYEGKCAIYGPVYSGLGNASSSSRYFISLGNGTLETPQLDYHDSRGWWRFFCARNGSNMQYFFDDYGVTSNYLGSGSSVTCYFSSDNLTIQYFAYKGSNEQIDENDGENSLVSFPSYNDYVNGLNNVYSMSDGQVVVTDTGEAPTVLDGDTIADTVADIQDGVTSWENAIPAIQAAEGDTTGDIVGENSVIGKKALDELVTGLNVSQIQNKFPFCIPNDLKQIATGAANVSGNAPVIVVPLKLEFAGHTYYDDDEAVVIDFAEFSQLALIFRKGFLLLFLIGMIYLSIYVVSSFFHITE